MLKSNTLNKIIAVAVALTLWAYVITTESPMQTTIIRGIPVHFENLDALAAVNLTVANDIAYSVDLTVEGKRMDISTLTAEDFSAFVDLSGRQQGERSVPVNVGGPGNVSILEKRPPRLTLFVEDLVSVSKPVRIEYTEPFPNGKEPGFISISPESVELTGAKSQVDGVEYVRALLASSALESAQKSFVVAAELVDREGAPVEDPLLLSHSDIEVRAMLCSVREAPLSVEIIGEAPSNLEVTDIQIPDRMRIKGSELALAQVGTLTAAPIDISKIEVTSNVPLTVDLPAGVEAAETSKNISVAVTIKGIETKEFRYASNEVVMEGLAEGYRAYVTDGDVTVSVSGTENVMTDLKREDITPYVDLSAIDPFVIGPELPLAPQPVRLRYEKALRKAEAQPEFLNLNIVPNPPEDDRTDEERDAESPAPAETSNPAETPSEEDASAAGNGAAVQNGVARQDSVRRNLMWQGRNI
jgi:YbbR domain-containing protein